MAKNLNIYHLHSTNWVKIIILLLGRIFGSPGCVSEEVDLTVSYLLTAIACAEYVILFIGKEGACSTKMSLVEH